MITTAAVPALNHLFLQGAVAEAGGRSLSYLTNFGLYLFSGNVPSSDRLRKLFSTGYAVSFSIGDVNTYLADIQGAAVLRMYSSVKQLPIEASTDAVKIKFSLCPVVGTSLLDTPPTHGILLYDCSAVHDTSMYGYRGIEFSVGDENSDADMRIMGGFIPKDAQWKPNDITINFAGYAK